jgi:hypothetical protein
MESIPSLSQALEILFFEEAPRLAKEQQVIKRHRCFSASSLLLVFVLGWLQHPLAGPSRACSLCPSSRSAREQTSRGLALDGENRPVASPPAGTRGVDRTYGYSFGRRIACSLPCRDPGRCLQHRACLSRWQICGKDVEGMPQLLRSNSECDGISALVRGLGHSCKTGKAMKRRMPSMASPSQSEECG